MGRKRRNFYVKCNAGKLNIDINFVLFGQHELEELDRYYLPAGNGETGWKATNPKSDQGRLSTLNQEREGFLLPVARMMKWWNRERNADRLKGIHLEVMVETAMQWWIPDRRFSALRHLFLELPALVENTCDDPTGLGAPLDSTLPTSDRLATREQLDADGLAVLMAGFAINEGNDMLAVSHLRQVFPV